MIFLKIAFLSIRKHLKRTLLIVGAVALSVMVLLLVSSIFEGLRQGFFEKMLSSSGHIQVQAQGRSEALDPYSLEYTLENPEELMNTLGEDPRVRKMDSILSFGALLIHDRENAPVQGHGIHTDTPYFSDVREGIQAGSFLDSDGEILVSEATRELLGLELGGPAVVLAEDSTGSPFYIEYTVSGIFRTDSPEFDQSTFLITHSAAEELLYLENATTEIRLTLDEREAAAAFKERHREAAEEAGGEIRTWREIYGSFTVMLEFFDLFMYVINLLVVIVAGTVITNAILMNVFEKSGEYGTMRAIGMKRRQHFMLVLTEGSVQGLLGALLGIAVGIPITVYLQQNGIYVGAATDAFGLGSSVYTVLTIRNVLLGLLTGVLVAVVGSLYAAAVNMRFTLVDLTRQA